MSFRLLAISLLLLASPLFSATITRNAPIVSAFENSISGAFPEFFGVEGNNATLLLPEFDPSLGTLTSVELTLSLNIATFTNVTNSVLGIGSGPNPTPVPIDLLLTPSNVDVVLLSVSGLPLLSTTASSLFAPVVLPPGSAAVNTSSTTLDSAALSPAFFSLLTGEGIASVSLMSTDNYLLQSQGLGADSFAGAELVTPLIVTLNGSLTAVYTYTPAVVTPEPAFTALIAVFLVAGLASRRRPA